MSNEREVKIYNILNDLMKVCNLSGESGTMLMFSMLCEALNNVDLNVVEQSQADGLCYNVNWLLAETINKTLSKYTITTQDKILICSQTKTLN